MPTSRLNGGCFCGQVRYGIGSVFDTGYCHCTACRRIHGAPVVAWIAVPEPDFTLLAGTPRGFRSSAHGSRHFCTECGSHLYYTDDRGVGLMSVYTATLDDPALVPPRIHQWCGDRLPWFDTRDDAPRVVDGTLPHPDRRG